MRRNYLGEMRRGLLLTQGPGSILEFRVDDAAISVIFPGLELVLFNLFETLKDIKLFIKDLS